MLMLLYMPLLVVLFGFRGTHCALHNTADPRGMMYGIEVPIINCLDSKLDGLALSARQYGPMRDTNKVAYVHSCNGVRTTARGTNQNTYRQLAMPTSTNLFRFLLSLVIRLRRSVGRIALVVRAGFVSFWRSILTFAHRSVRSQIRLHANDVPGDKTHTEERLQIPEYAKVEEEDNGTLAVPPVQPIMDWEDKLSKYQAEQAPTKLESHPQPATPEQASQRYKARTVR